MHLLQSREGHGAGGASFSRRFIVPVVWCRRLGSCSKQPVKQKPLRDRQPWTWQSLPGLRVGAESSPRHGRIGIATAGSSPLPRRLRPICGARNRRGEACVVRVEPGKRRCRFHDGLSTGPRTSEGKAGIAEAQRRRWARSSTKTLRDADNYNPTAGGRSLRRARRARQAPVPVS